MSRINTSPGTHHVLGLVVYRYRAVNAGSVHSSVSSTWVHSIPSKDSVKTQKPSSSHAEQSGGSFTEDFLDYLIFLGMNFPFVRIIHKTF